MSRVVVRIGLVALVLVGAFGSTAAAQPETWGVSASFTPRWSTPGGVKGIFMADEVSIEGRDVRVGIVRGRAQGGDWGFSFVRQTMEAGGVVVTGDRRDVLDDGVVMTGAAFEYYGAFFTISRRVQIGAATSFGAASIKGTATRDGADTVPFAEVLTLGGYNTRVSPLVRVELAVAVILADRLKVRASGGYNYPGVSRLTLGGVLFLGR